MQVVREQAGKEWILAIQAAIAVCQWMRKRRTPRLPLNGFLPHRARLFKIASATPQRMPNCGRAPRHKIENSPPVSTRSAAPEHMQKHRPREL